MTRHKHLWEVYEDDSGRIDFTAKDSEDFIDGIFSVPAELSAITDELLKPIKKPDVTPAYVEGRVIGAFLAYKNFKATESIRNEASQ